MFVVRTINGPNWVADLNKSTYEEHVVPPKAAFILVVTEGIDECATVETIAQNVQNKPGFACVCPNGFREISITLASGYEKIGCVDINKRS